jgi:hypothetical protein
MRAWKGGTPHPSLVDPEFWRGLLGAPDATDQRLLVYPRPDLSEPGVEVVEFRLGAHDGEALWGLCARSSFRGRSDPTCLRVVEELGSGAVEWDGVRAGRAEVLLRLPEHRCLKDRVIDILRTVRAIRELAGPPTAPVELAPPREGPLPDCLLIARALVGACV